MKLGYARVSTRDQNLDLQVDALKRAGCERIYQDVASGSKTARPALDELLAQVRAGDVLVIWKLDRLGRSLAHLVELVGDLVRRKVGLVSLNDPIDTTSAQGRLVFNIFASLAEFERELIRERTQAGLCAGASIFVRYQRDRAKEERAKADAMEHLLRKPDGPAELLEQLVGTPMADVVRRHKPLLEQTRADLLAAIAKARNAQPPTPTEHWAVAEGYQGIESAQLVVVNIRNESARRQGEELVGDLGRLRKEPALFNDILRGRGSKIQITAVVANLNDPKDAGLKKALARVGRAMRRGS